MATLTLQARAAVTTTLSAAMGGLTGTRLVSSAPVEPHFRTSTNHPSFGSTNSPPYVTYLKVLTHLLPYFLT